MRQILFRGKDKDNNWVYGSLIKKVTGKTYIYEYKTGEEIEVNTDTVTGSTGIYCLKNGKKTEIFEGDVLKTKHTHNNVLYEIYDGLLGLVRWDEEEATFYIDLDIDFINMSEITLETEIVGNIWDNPEYLEEINVK